MLVGYCGLARLLGDFGPSDDVFVGSGVLLLKRQRSEMQQSQHFGLRAIQV